MVFSQSSLPVIKDVVAGKVIGEGTFGCVRSAHLKFDPGVLVAVKYVHLPSCKEQGLSEKDVMKEVVLHSRCSKHPNVLKLIDCNVSGDYMWVLLELADGGDLFDKIEPDVGVDPEVAQFYFQQLTRAIYYLHVDCGVAHRDIKPENILLDKNGNLKLADFGLASQFRRKDGTMRVCLGQRGSPPYMAPEILHDDETGYYADATDIWSCGVFLFVLLTGEIPWGMPVKEDESFEWFISNGGNLSIGPWEKIDLRQMNLLRKILQPNPTMRITIQKLRQHPWVTTKCKLADSRGLCRDPDALARRLLGKLRVSLSNETYMKFTQDATLFDTAPAMKFRATQPIEGEIAQLEYDPADSNTITNTTSKAFTQIESRDDPVLSTKHSERWTQYISNEQVAFQFRDDEDSLGSKLKFNPTKYTKFFSLEPMDTLLPVLENALIDSGIRVKSDLYLHYEKLRKELDQDTISSLVINIKTRDRRGGNLAGSVMIVTVEDCLKSISFNRKTGDPLEWRRLFKRVAVLSREIILIPSKK